MATIHQIEANRLNARKSTGPRSAHGKAASSQNALKSGIDAQSEIIPGEKPGDLDALAAEYLDSFQPTTPEERLFVDTLVRDDWQLRRLARVEAQIWEHTIANFFDPDEDTPLGHAFTNSGRTFERLQRRINATGRSYRNALHELQQIQSTRETQPAAGPVSATTTQPAETKPLNQPIGFVPSPPPPPLPNPLALRKPLPNPWFSASFPKIASPPPPAPVSGR